MEVIHSSKTMVLTRATRRNIPGDNIILLDSFLFQKWPKTGCGLDLRIYCTKEEQKDTRSQFKSIQSEELSIYQGEKKNVYTILKGAGEQT
jgi:hypothetical protein